MRHNTDWNKELKDPEQYTSNWDWTVAHSEYHFDNSIQDKSGDWLDVLGRFDNPKQWLAERDVLVEASKPVNWATRKYFGDTDDESPMLSADILLISRAFAYEEASVRDVKSVVAAGLHW